ncbi:MAG: NUDIX domain-containing protein [Patescibacteria group bacterium]|nr:NUDIX domain-containing protein [Patescibacteria group bacterium]
MKIGFDYIGVTTPFYCLDENGRLLMHRRSAICRDEQGRWDTGSGQLEHGLSLRENVLKEVGEEYGCDGEILEQLPAHDIFREQSGVRTHWVAVPFFIRVNHDDVRINEPDKIDELGWFTLDSLPTPLHTGFSFSFEKFRERFERHMAASGKA